MKTCEELRDLLSEHIDGVLDEECAAELRAHLDQCEECRQLLADLQNTVALVRDIPDVEPPENLLEQIHARLDASTEEAEPRPTIKFAHFFSLPQVRVAVAAGLLIMIGVYGMIQMTSPKDLPREHEPDPTTPAPAKVAAPMPASDEVVDVERKTVSAQDKHTAARPTEAAQAKQDNLSALAKAQPLATAESIAAPAREPAPGGVKMRAAARETTTDARADRHPTPAKESLKAKPAYGVGSRAAATGADSSAAIAPLTAETGGGGRAMAPPTPLRQTADSMDPGVSPRPTPRVLREEKRAEQASDSRRNAVEADGALWKKNLEAKDLAQTPIKKAEAERKEPVALADMSRHNAAMSDAMIAQPAQTMAPAMAAPGSLAMGRGGAGKGTVAAKAEAPDFSRADALALTVTRAKRADVLKVINAYRTVDAPARTRTMTEKSKITDPDIVTLTIPRAKYREFLQKLQQLGLVAVAPAAIQGKPPAETRDAEGTTAVPAEKADAPMTLHIRIIEK